MDNIKHLELPREIWTEIVTYCTLGSIYNLSQTCGKMNRIINVKKRDLYLKFMIEENIESQIRDEGKIYEGKIRYLPNGKIIFGFLYPKFQCSELSKWIEEQNRSFLKVEQSVISIQTVEGYATIEMTGNDNIITKITIIDPYSILPKTTTYPFQDGWISGTVIEEKKFGKLVIEEKIEYVSGIPLLDIRQQIIYNFDRIRFKPILRKDGSLLIDSYRQDSQDKDNGYMTRIFKEIFIGIGSIRSADKDGFIDTLRVRINSKEPSFRFLFGGYTSSTFIQNLGKILNRLYMSHLWQFLKAYD